MFLSQVTQLTLQDSNTLLQVHTKNGVLKTEEDTSLLHQVAVQAVPFTQTTWQQVLHLTA